MEYAFAMPANYVHGTSFDFDKKDKKKLKKIYDMEQKKVVKLEKVREEMNI